MLVYGVSGTGKSSLINCGLANKFQDTDWLPVNVRRGGDMVKSMVLAIGKAAITPLNSIIESPVQFKKAIQSLYLDHYKPIYFIFDQFEELFIFGNREERKAFAQIIKTLAASELQCRFLFIMREEYLAGVTEFEKTIPDFLANRARIEKMSLANAQQAIEGPCGKFNITLEEGFSGNLLEKLYPNDAEVELTYLQVFLDKLYRLAITDKSGETKIFSKKMLEKTGNVSDLLGSFLDEQISLLADPETALAVLKSFVSVKGTKRQMSSDEVKEYTHTLGKHLESSTLIELLQNFVHLRILRDRDQNEKFELRHDAIASKIYEKFTAIEKDIIEVRQFIENAFSAYEKRGRLLSTDDIKYITPYEDKLFLKRESESFIIKSKNELVRTKRRRRTISIAFVVLLFIVLSGFSIWAINERKKADKERETAEIQKENAIIANEKAIKSGEEAMQEKQRALENEKTAIKAKEEAELSKGKALNAENQALIEKNQALIERSKANTALQDKIAAEARLAATAKNFVVSAEKMNILYKWIENPISFAISGIDSGSINFQFDQKAELLWREGKSFIIPHQTGILNIALSLVKGVDTTRLGERTFRVKNLPNPEALLGGKSSGFILKDSLVNLDRITILTPDFDFEAEYRILSYKATCQQPMGHYITYTGDSLFPVELKNAFIHMGHKQKLTFENITVEGPDSLIRNIGSINLYVLQQESWDDDFVYSRQMDDFVYRKYLEEMKQVALENVDKYYLNSPRVLNKTAYLFYSYVNDTASLVKALRWAEIAVASSKENCGYMDTYASLLFKLGRLDEAELIEMDALKIAKSKNEPTEDYEKLLELIRNSR
jgi:hypothetical protein